MACHKIGIPKCYSITPISNIIYNNAPIKDGRFALMLTLSYIYCVIGIVYRCHGGIGSFYWQ